MPLFIRNMKFLCYKNGLSLLEKCSFPLFAVIFSLSRSYSSRKYVLWRVLGGILFAEDIIYRIKAIRVSAFPHNSTGMNQVSGTMDVPRVSRVNTFIELPRTNWEHFQVNLPNTFSDIKIYLMNYAPVL